MDYEKKGSSVSSGSDGDSADQRDVPECIFKFRNYTPQTHFIDGIFSVEKSQPGTISHLIEDKLDILSKGGAGYRIDPKLMEPKKEDWDLKRRIEKRMETLERATRKSIAKHIKETKKKRR